MMHRYFESSDGHVAFGIQAAGPSSNPAAVTKPESSLAIGYALAAANVLLDVGGALITKEFGNVFNTFEIGGIRFGSSAIILWITALTYRNLVRPSWPLAIDPLNRSVEIEPLRNDLSEVLRSENDDQPTQANERRTQSPTQLMVLDAANDEARGATYANDRLSPSRVGEASTIRSDTRGGTKANASSGAVGPPPRATTNICGHSSGCSNSAAGGTGLCVKHDLGDDHGTLNVPWWWILPPMLERSWTLVVVGVFVTTFLCPTLQNYAIFELPIATYSTLVSLTPIWSLPVVFVLKGERVSARAILGSVAAVIGIVPLYI
jgi:hypothetical protein